MDFIKKRSIKTDNKISDILSSILSTILFPIVLLFGGLVLIFIVAPISLWQQLTISKAELNKRKEDELEMLNRKSEWSIFSSINDLKIEKQLAGSLPWDSGDYFYLQSSPTIPYLKDKLFGDWLMVDFGGIFVQRWNHERQINCDLVFIDANTLQVIELQKGIPSKNWRAEKVSTGEIQFTYTTADFELTYEIGLAELNKKRIV